MILAARLRLATREEVFRSGLLGEGQLMGLAARLRLATREEVFRLGLLCEGAAHGLAARLRLVLVFGAAVA